MREKLTKIVDKYKKKVDEVRNGQNINGGSSFLDITGNLLTRPSLIAQISTEGKKFEGMREDFLTDLKDLKTYLSLLRKYPDFAKAELYGSKNKGENYFPDLVD